MRDMGTVYVGLSGGVDSSVSALRLTSMGYRVVGVFIKTWVPDFLDCNIEGERLDAMRVAASLEIPFLTLDATEEYKNEVAEYMIREYKEGRTPNPDVMCNRHVKFGAFLRYALKEGAAKVATGHYAQVKKEVDSVFHLYRGADTAKDQSYFLWMLNQEDLSKILFPVGDSPKSTVREEAGKYGLPTAGKQDSQGVCFLGHVDMKEFLSHYVISTPGDVLNEEGKIIGTHDGALFYTIGQRSGFTVHTEGASSEAHFVVAKNMEHNTITVSEKPHGVGGKHIELSFVNQIARPFPETCEAQFRYRQKPFDVRVESLTEGRAMLTVITPDVELPSRGQSCVLYEGTECLGGGIIHTIS